MDAILRGIHGLVAGMWRRDRFPRRVTVTRLISDGCLFEVSNPVEAYRVQALGGEEEFISSILEELKPSDVLFDCGACVGVVTIHAAKLGAHVVAFEPDSNFRERLAMNLWLNGLDRVQVVKWAISDRPGEALLYSDGLGGNSPGLLPLGRGASAAIRTGRLDDAVEGGELPRPTVVKMDIEGAEILALRGMQRILSSASRPRAIFLETHPKLLALFDSDEVEVIGLLESQGYRQVFRRERGEQVHYLLKASTQKQDLAEIARKE